MYARYLTSGICGNCRLIRVFLKAVPLVSSKDFVGGGRHRELDDT